MTASDAPFRWRAVAVSAFLPTILFSIGEGAIIPVIPVVASSLGATLAVAGFIAAMILVGELLGDIPSGALVARVGERTAMIGACGLSVGGLLIAVLARDPLWLGVGILLMGIAAAVFALARHAFMTSFVPLAQRARALSTLGGTFRFGFLVGPFLTAGAIQLTGTVESALWIDLVAALLTGVVLLVLADPAAGHPAGDTVGDGAIEVAEETHGLFRTIAARRDVLLTLGVGSMIVAALRASRQVILPLWAVSILLDETSTAVIIGIAGAVDFALFYLGGWIMDRFGRLWTILPSLLGLAVGHLALALTHELDARVTWFIAIAMVMSVANGIGAGILMTLGADLADPRHPAPFLGAWRFTNDTGAALAPLIVVGITAAASLAVATGVLGVVGLVGAVILRVTVPRHSARPPASHG